MVHDKRNVDRLSIRSCGMMVLPVVAGTLVGLAGSGAWAQESPPAVEAAAPTYIVEDVPVFSVSGFSVRYENAAEGLPAIEELLTGAKAMLVRRADGYGVAAEASELQARTIAELNTEIGGGVLFSRGALEEVNRALVRAMNDRGLIGVLVATDDRDIGIEVVDPAAPLAAAVNPWSDLRPGASGELRIVLYTARVVEVRTVGSGERVSDEEGLNHPIHARILANSPIVPASEKTAAGEDILRKDLIDDYTFRLNRHPGRRVDVAVSLADQPGDVVLDYLIRENKPWFIYGQLSNTGTEETNELRQRFGFIHNQLTNNDDQLAIEYVTTGFEDTHGVSGSYEFPIADRLRLRPFASYSEFDASDVGQADEGFDGESWAVGGDLSWNFFQHRELFIDFVAGVRWEDVKVNNRTVAVKGEDSFFLPTVGFDLERVTDEAVTTAYIRTEWNMDGIAATGDPSLENLGRTDPDADWVTLQWGFAQSFYLEPLIDRQRFEDGQSTLAHEILVSFRAQHAFDSRLAPNFQQVVGGMDSVRGYPESAVAGDDVFVGSIEYRLHIPRLLKPYDEAGETPPDFLGGPFRMRPQTRYGRPDWDLIGKLFLDVGRAENSDRQPFETDETLIGAGYGIELLVGRNLSFRLDWGVALEEVKEPTHVTTGSSRVHFAITVLF